MTLKELQAKAKELNIVGRSKMNKEQLHTAVEAASVFKDEIRLQTPRQDVIDAQPKHITDDDYKLVFGTMSKGEARKFRKELHAKGMVHQAAIKAA